MGPVPLTPLQEDSSDEELVAMLAAGQQEALGPLYGRYASFIYNLAAQSVDRTAAEEIVQDVLLTVWRKASLFDPERGPFRPWVLQIAHFRIINELRRRSRRPQLEPDPEGIYLRGVADSAPGVDEEVWREERRAAVRAAMASLPQAQQQAVSLAFLAELTHPEVASALDVPLGTAKTRIRAGLQKLRTNLAPLGVAVLIVGAAAIAGMRYANDLALLHREDGALTLVTDSSTQALRLTAAPGVSESTHAVYRSQAGSHIAVVTFEHFAQPPAGRTYQAWVRHGGVWTSLGAVKPNAEGDARLIVDKPALAQLPEAIEVTLEPANGSASPSGPVIVNWSGS